MTLNTTLIIAVCIALTYCKTKTDKRLNMEESPQKGYLQKAFEVPVKRYCMTMELENDPQLIEEYKE